MKRVKRVLLTTRDGKPGMIGTLVAKELATRGVEIAVVAEGLSLEKWKKAGFVDAIFAEGPLKIDEPWGISAPAILSEVRPDVVVIGLSSPIRAEAWFASATRPQGTLFPGIPLVALDDNWGATYRCPTPADLVLTIDELGKRLVEQNPAYAEHNYRVEIIGDLSASAASEPIPQATIDAFNKAKGGADYAFLLCSQKWPESTEIIDIALASCAKSLENGAKLVVIPRFHPGASSELRNRLNEKMMLFAERYQTSVSILVDHSISTDHLATLADGTFAATGSALRAAAYAGKIPICVWTPALGEKLKAESGMEHHPLLMSFGGLALGLNEPLDVVGHLFMVGDLVRTNQKKILQPVPFDVGKAADAIVALMQ